ncbi:short-chain dehydrogenase [Pedobacter ginsengisoli]|uniref:Short-chain dehydrogenase n=1 Tax=Pedobacter ginsengisoli TaxID=363852 RepID=A0A2D1U923_9SPHI|nr:pirin family protein [Pedobacter ginsengisoli]ATP58099.1 short-chain dehydrogenase [Pedobacter ginsengisoli]
MEAKIKTVSAILNAPAPHMVGDGFRVHNFFPKGYKIKMSPFFMLDYNSRIEFSARNAPRGVGVHPHRGFETVTIAYHGAVAHHDSAGNSGVIYPGDVQWMTAGSGILHKEYHEEAFSKKGGAFQMVQLWVNLPAKNKMTTPKYQEVKHSDIARYKLDDEAGMIEVIAGEYNETKGSASTFTPLNLLNARLNKGGKAYFDFPAEYNTGFMIIEGSVKINGTEIAKTDQFVHFKNEGTAIEAEALENSIVLILSGEPINEPIAQYGPFLMNKPEEIQEAINDYNQGKFGYLDE